MKEEIELVRNMVWGRINEIESFPADQAKDAQMFQNWVKDINTGIRILYQVGDHCFAGFPTLGFPPGFFSPSRETINDSGFTAIMGYLDMVKLSLNTPIA